jgi:hypothetical protein
MGSVRRMLSAAIASSLLACDRGEEASVSGLTAQPRESVQAEMLEICRSLRESDEPYSGEVPAIRLAAALDSTDPGTPGHERIVLALAQEWLEQGRVDEVLDLLDDDDAARVDTQVPVARKTTKVSEADPSSRADRSTTQPTPRSGPQPDGPSGARPIAQPIPQPIPQPLSSSASLTPGGGRGDATDPAPAVRRLALRRNAHLQAGEDENCVLRHTAASCILPIREEGRHLRPDHARRSGDLSLALLRARPGSASARWLLNLSRMVSGDYPTGVPEGARLPAAALVSEEPAAGWIDRAPQLGVSTPDLAGGAILDDFDGDGFLDLVSSSSGPCDPIRAFRNDGHGGFEDVSAAWGLDHQLGGLNLVHGDFDGDGRLDLLVLRGAWLDAYGQIRNSLLHNRIGDLDGGFEDVTRAAGLAEPALPTQSAAFSDYDGDGDLDLYVGNEAWSGRPYPSQLFRNEGDGTFSEVGIVAGVANFRFAKGVAWGDFDQDGDPDLYVSNIGTNRLYRNDGEDRFVDVAAELGVAEPVGRSFATWFFDYDNDGRLDLFVADYGAAADDVISSYLGGSRASGHPVVYRNTGEGFEEVSSALGLDRPLLPMGANYADFDNDGWLDLYLGTGNPRFEVLVPNVAYRNQAGRGFSEVGFASGLAHLQKGHGVAFGDVDNDGDEDLFHQLGGFYPGDTYGNALFENPSSDARWITLRLEGRRANRFGVGTRIRVNTNGPSGRRVLHRVVGSGGSFGGSSLQQEIGLGDAEAIEELQLIWPGSGVVQRFEDVALDRIYRIIEGIETIEPLEVPALHLGGSSQDGDRHRHPVAPSASEG